jgi:HEPN domain-containing protein
VTAIAMLDQAREVLHGSARSRNRMACWLARSALEQVVRDLLIAQGRTPGGANMTSLLTCLEVSYRHVPEVAERADFAWARLSNACHQHAFELSPTATEAARLVDAVAELLAFAAVGADEGEE